ncbi:MAG: hypothetical protein AMJ66_06265 [Betaproteobacteria bacterium SG8_40]|nr:MAG: hypothetical protein AMJ66_06265 [Betaproteobacteria bacterium SG8_40]
MDWRQDARQAVEMLTTPKSLRKCDLRKFGRNSSHIEAKLCFPGGGFVVAFQGLHDLVANDLVDAAGGAIECCAVRFVASEFVSGPGTALLGPIGPGGVVAMNRVHPFWWAGADKAVSGAMSRKPG